MARRHVQPALVLLFAMTALHAQTGKPSGLPNEPVPATAEAGRSGTLTLGLRIANEFDDNALNDNRHKQSNFMTVVEPHVTWKASRPRLEWLLRYTNGFAMNRQLPA